MEEGPAAPAPPAAQEPADSDSDTSSTNDSSDSGGGGSLLGIIGVLGMSMSMMGMCRGDCNLFFVYILNSTLRVICAVCRTHDVHDNTITDVLSSHHPVREKAVSQGVLAAVSQGVLALYPRAC